MTIAEILHLVKGLNPSQYDDTLLVHWLSKLDGQIWRELILTHVGAPTEEFTGYNSAVSLDTVLLVPEPYAEDVYNHFLQAQIHKENSEMEEYNQSITFYNDAYRLYASWYTRTHQPLPKYRRFRF